MSKAIPARKELAAKAVRHQHQTRVRESRVALSSSGKTATAIASQQKQIERLQVELKEMRRAAQEKESREAQEKESREAQERLIDSIKASGAEISQLRFSQKTGPDAEKREQIKLRYDELQEKIKSDIGSLKENDPNAAKKIEDQLKELQDLQIFKEKATRRIRSLETENKKIQSAGDTLQLNIDSINETLKSERVQNNLLRQEGENLEETLRTTKLSLEAKNGENTELNTQLSEARSKIENVSKLNSILSESLEAEKNNKGILQEELSSNAELLRDTQGQNSSLQQEKESLEETLRTTRSSLETANKKIELLNEGFDKFAKTNGKKEFLKDLRRKAEIVFGGDDIISSLTGIMTNFVNLEEHVFGGSIQNISEIQDCEPLGIFGNSIKDLGEKIKALSPSADNETVNKLLNDLGGELIFSLHNEQLSLSAHNIVTKFIEDVVKNTSCISDTDLLSHEFTDTELASIGSTVKSLNREVMCLHDKQIKHNELLDSLQLTSSVQLEQEKLEAKSPSSTTSAQDTRVVKPGTSNQGR